MQKSQDFRKVKPVVRRALFVGLVALACAGCTSDDNTGGAPCISAQPGSCLQQTQFCGADNRCQACVPGTLNCNGNNLDYCEVQGTACGQLPPPTGVDSGGPPSATCQNCMTGSQCCDNGICRLPNQPCSTGGVCQNGICSAPLCTGCVHPNCCDNGLCKTVGQTCTNGNLCQNGGCYISDGY